MVPFGLLDAPCQTSHAALCHTLLDASAGSVRGYLDGLVQPHLALAAFSRCVGHGPLSSAATAGPIRAHHRARPLPDRKGTRITRRDGGIWWTLPDLNRPHPACRAGALPNELKAQVREVAPLQVIHCRAQNRQPPSRCWRFMCDGIRKDSLTVSNHSHHTNLAEREGFYPLR